MKILVLSDIHNRGSVAESIIAKYPDIQHIFFLGDGISHIEDLSCFFPEKIFHSVSGNCDGFASEPSSAFCKLGGKKIFFTHGHPYSVKWGLARLKAEAEAMGADLALYGHTHIQKEEYENGVYYVNPGAVSGYPACYAVIDLDKAGIMPNLLHI